VVVRVLKELESEHRLAESKAALEALRLQCHQAKKMESLGILAGGVAHDMNNVLGAILALASAHICRQPADSPEHQAFATIIQAAERGGQMMRSLLTFARQSPAEEGEMDLNGILRQEAKLLAVLPAAAEAPAGTVWEGFDVLVVDDDALIQGTTRVLLEFLKHRVTTVASGEEALAKLEAGPCPDLVILDMNMPGLGGLGTLPRLRAQHPALPVILATGRADQAALDLVAAHPSVLLMCKPYGITELEQSIQAAAMVPQIG
jgi:CheY-like chemotaxis protein